MAETQIEWTDRVWNPVTGCTKVSQGCKHCYAETVANRFWKRLYPLWQSDGGWGVRPFTEVRTHADKLTEPLKWRKSQRVFVNSMSDLFHEAVPDEFIDQVFAVMALAPQHTFQVLTKRPERMLDYCRTLGRHHTTDRVSLAAKALQPDGEGFWYTLRGGGAFLPNVHLGVSVEDQQTADARIPLLLRTPAALRFISAEPLLGRINLAPRWTLQSAQSEALAEWAPILDWVIVGGESGADARPCDVAWVRGIVRQCQAASVPVFVKQLGASVAVSEATCSLERAIRDGGYELKSRKGSDMTEWPEDLRVRQMPMSEEK